MHLLPFNVQYSAQCYTATGTVSILSPSEPSHKAGAQPKQQLAERTMNHPGIRGHSGWAEREGLQSVGAAQLRSPFPPSLPTQALHEHAQGQSTHHCWRPASAPRLPFFRSNLSPPGHTDPTPGDPLLDTLSAALATPSPQPSRH